MVGRSERFTFQLLFRVTIIVNEQFECCLNHVAMTEFRSTTASKFDLLTLCNSFFELLNESESGSFAFFDLFCEPTIKAGYSFFACCNFISGGCAVDIGPLITEGCASANVDKGIVLWA